MDKIKVIFMPARNKPFNITHAHLRRKFPSEERKNILTLTFRDDRLIFHPIIDRFRIGFGLALEYNFLANRTANQLILYHQHGRNCWGDKKIKI